jgi:flagellar protein FlaG
MLRVNTDVTSYAAAYTDGARSATRISASTPTPTSPSTTNADAAKTAADAASTEQVKAAVDTVNAAIESRNVQLKFDIDAQTKQIVTRVVDKTSGEVLRQIPSDVVLRLARAMSDKAGSGSNTVPLVQTVA